MTSSSVGAWRLAALQLLGAAERFIRRDGEPHTATDQLCNFEQFRERVAMLRSQVEELEGDRVEFMPDWARCELVRNPIAFKPEERFGLVGPGGITWVKPEELERLARIQPRWCILDEELLEHEARQDWVLATGMV